MNFILIICLVLAIISIPVVGKISYKKGNAKGIEQGRDQVLKENVIRLKNDIERLRQEEKQLAMSFGHVSYDEKAEVEDVA